ncbi:MAG: hypothetical protein LBF94_03705 [Puniceicoccales bacterium]|nr:hypothetical protein [Puniceicoccales bacterium]
MQRSSSSNNDDLGILLSGCAAKSVFEGATTKAFTCCAICEFYIFYCIAVSDDSVCFTKNHASDSIGKGQFTNIYGDY